MNLFGWELAIHPAGWDLLIRCVTLLILFEIGKLCWKWWKL